MPLTSCRLDDWGERCGVEDRPPRRLQGGSSAVPEPDPRKFLLAGVSVVLPPHASYLLHQSLLRPWLAKIRLRDLSPELQSLVRAIEVSARHYAVERIKATKRAVDGIPGIPPASAPPTLDHEMTTSTAGRLMGCTARNVRALATTGSLRGRRVAGRWLFDQAEVEALVARRGER